MVNITNIQPLSSDIGKVYHYGMINPSPFGLEVYHNKLPLTHLGLESYIYYIHLLAMVFIIYIYMYVATVCVLPLYI